MRTVTASGTTRKARFTAPTKRVRSTIDHSLSRNAHAPDTKAAKNPRTKHPKMLFNTNAMVLCAWFPSNSVCLVLPNEEGAVHVRGVLLEC